MHLRSGLPAAGRPDLRSLNMQNMLNIHNMQNKLSCPLPRVRVAGRRSNTAVDMFERAAAVTINLFWSGCA